MVFKTLTVWRSEKKYGHYWHCRLKLTDDTTETLPAPEELGGMTFVGAILWRASLESSSPSRARRRILKVVPKLRSCYRPPSLSQPALPELRSAGACVARLVLGLALELRTATIFHFRYKSFTISVFFYSRDKAGITQNIVGKVLNISFFLF